MRHSIHVFIFFFKEYKQTKQHVRVVFSLIFSKMTMEMDHDEDDMGGVDMNLTAASTTIDSSVVESRIRQSASLQKENDDEMQRDSSDDQPVFPKLSAAQASGNKVEYRRLRCPPHRYTPLREHWEQILTPLVEYLKLQVRLK